MTVDAVSASVANRTIPPPPDATSITVTTRNSSALPEVPIVVIAKGELGNIIMRLLHGLSVALESRDVPTRLSLRMGGSGQTKKFLSSLPILKSCFADIASRVDFGPSQDDPGAGKREMEELQRRQRAWLGKDLANELILKEVRESGPIRERMNHLKPILKGMTEASGDAEKMCDQATPYDL